MKRLRNLTRLLPLAAALSLASCVDDPTGGGVVDEDYQVLVQVQGGGTVAVNPFGTVTGSVNLAEGVTRNATIRLLDEQGNAVVTGPGDQLRVVVTNTVVASFTAAGQQGSTLTGSFRGNDSGGTSFRVQYLQAGVAAYQTPLIDIDVTS